MVVARVKMRRYAVYGGCYHLDLVYLCSWSTVSPSRRRGCLVQLLFSGTASFLIQDLAPTVALLYLVCQHNHLVGVTRYLSKLPHIQCQCKHYLREGTDYRTTIQSFYIRQATFTQRRYYRMLRNSVHTSTLRFHSQSSVKSLHDLIPFASIIRRLNLLPIDST